MPKRSVSDFLARIYDSSLDW